MVYRAWARLCETGSRVFASRQRELSRDDRRNSRHIGTLPEKSPRVGEARGVMWDCGEIPGRRTGFVCSYGGQVSGFGT